MGQAIGPPAAPGILFAQMDKLEARCGSGGLFHETIPSPEASLPARAFQDLRAGQHCRPQCRKYWRATVMLQRLLHYGREGGGTRGLTAFSPGLPRPKI